MMLDNSGEDNLEWGETDTFLMDIHQDIGDLQSVDLYNSGSDGWFPEDVIVTNMGALITYTFEINTWIKGDDTETFFPQSKLYKFYCIFKRCAMIVKK